MKSHITRAIDICGSQSELARLCGISQGAVWKWTHGGQISAENAISVELATGGQVARSQLRPDIFPASDLVEV